MQRATDLLDEMSELVYICDLNTHELLYLNSAAKKSFGVEELCGQKCYRVLQGLDSPCPFCTNEILRDDAFYTWEFTNPRTERHYILKDKLVDYDGRKARIEIAFDLTDKVNERLAMKYMLDAENFTLECVRLLHESLDVKETLGTIMNKIGGFLEAERAYIFEIRGDKMDNTYEWCAPGISPVIQSLQNLDVALIDRWRPFFDRHQCVIIEDLEQLREKSPEEYKTLHLQNIQRLVVEPLELDGQLVGYMGVDNPPAEKIRNIASLLDTLGYFIESTVHREEDRKLLERLSYHDTLTGALNRNAFMRDTRPEMFQDGRNVGVAYLDINGMKELNDQYGHLYGDSYLARAVGQIRAVFPGERVYRVGGDEFIILCSMPEDEFLQKVRELKRLFSGAGECSASVGYQWERSCGDVQKILFDADQILYTDKRDFYRGRAFSHRYRHGNDDILGLTQPGHLQKLIQQGSFQVFFQPKVSLTNGSLIGAEALCRYRDPDGELVPPDQFIPVLEEARMIAPLDFHNFEHTCAMLSAWQREGRKLVPVSVNFSRYSLMERDFAGRLFRVCNAYGILPKLLKIEITETVEEENHYAFLDVVEKIRSKGFSISIDDFGVRHANLALFVSCEFDELKLDRSLICDLEENGKARAIVQSTVGICRKMGIQLIAEGVETQGQAELLRKLDCEGAQGFLYSRPIPAEDYKNAYCPLPRK